MKTTILKTKLMRDRNGLIENPDKYLNGEIQGNVFFALIKM